MHREAEDAPLRDRQPPRRWVVGVELRARDGDAAGGIECDRRKAGGSVALRAVVVAAELATAEVETMNHAGRAVRHQQAARGCIEGEPAERGAAVRGALEGDIGKERDGAGRAVDAPDRSRAAALRGRSEQPVHEGCAGHALMQARRRAARTRRDDRQAICGGRGGVDIGRRRVVERDAEHLADLCRGRGERLGRRDHLRHRPRARARDIDDAQRRTIEIDDGLVGRIRARLNLRRRQGAGKSADDGIAGRDDTAAGRRKCLRTRRRDDRSRDARDQCRPDARNVPACGEHVAIPKGVMIALETHLGAHGGGKPHSLSCMQFVPGRRTMVIVRSGGITQNKFFGVREFRGRWASQFHFAVFFSAVRASHAA
ncbi:MAG TPA: hypothetical protein VKX28_03860 [Xanthobacteraceae bacterium]|nr:hypothetical protein [Xanthobacteraceae bacterium]